jgi:TonB-linked SusC/RagA family outer membrane protein
MLCVILLTGFCLPSPLKAQDATISGTVTSADDNSPLPGVTILVKGTSNGTSTDANGAYRLTVSDPNGTLVFSFIGYTSQEVPINSRTTVDVTLAADITELNEVVVVGYGTMKRSDVTGAITSISQRDVSNVRSVNVVESMQGKVAGVDMTRASGRAGSGYNINVRGTRSLTASNDPLYIVDGIQYTSNVDINPGDIESIEILKDASSTSIYGARGANGVIIITTKKGKKGEPRISFNTYQGITMPSGKLPVADRDYYINFMNDLVWMGDINYKWDAIPSRNPEGYIGKLQPRELEGLEQGTDYDWYDKILEHGSQQDYNLTFSGGSDKLIYSVSLNHYKENGMMDQDKYKRYNLRLNLEAPIKPFLSIGTNTIVTYYEQVLRDNPFGMARQLSPLVTPFVDRDGNMVDVDEADGENVKLIYYPNDPNTVTSNPLITADPNFHFNENRSGKVFTTLYADFSFLKNFTFKTSINAEIGYLRKGRFNGTYPETGNLSTAEVMNELTTNYQWQNILTYSREFNEHRIQVTGVNEVLFRRGELYREAVSNLALEQSQWYALNSYSGYTPVLNLPPEAPQREDFPLEVRKLVSYLARVNYSYKGKYSLQLSGRYDGASQLQDKWSFFPSASVAWNINEEAFLQGATFLSNLKLRAGYGVSGNYDVNVYSTIGRISGNPLYYNFGLNDANYNGYRTARSGNPLLGWERTEAINLGIDYGFLDGRVQGSIDVYETNTDDLLQDQLLPPSSGIPRITSNVGSTQNRGIELALTTTNVRTTHLTWTSNITFSRNVEKITELASGQTQDIANGWFVGSPVNVFYDKKKIGIWQLNEVEEAKLVGAQPGDVKFLELGSDDRMILGNPRPTWTGGFNNTIQYRNWDLNIFVYARIGQTIKDEVLGTLQPDGRTNMMELNYWTPENPTNDVPRLDPGRTNSGYSDLSSLLYTDGSFVKIRDITLGYSLPVPFISKIKLSKARVYATAKNPFIFSKFFNKEGGRYDPELNGSIDIPMPRMYALGLSLEF